MNTRYLVQRFLSTLLVALGVSFVVFLIIYLVPGDPARVILGVQATDENVAALRERLGLNRPFLVQYGSWLANAVQGDLGKSLITGQPVASQVMHRLPATLSLAFVALLVGMLIAFPLGITSALRPGSKIDVVASILSQIGVSVPDFWMGILLILFFSLALKWLPPSGYVPIGEDFVGWLKHLVLPALTAGIISGSIQTRFIRSAMLEVLHADYIRTARAKGLRERVVIIRHALRNAMIIIVTIIGLQITALISVIVVIEVIFAWPGLGRLSLEAVLDRDYPLLQGAVMTIALATALVNLMVDLLYVVLDPRIQYA